MSAELIHARSLHQASWTRVRSRSVRSFLRGFLLLRSFRWQRRHFAASMPGNFYIQIRAEGHRHANFVGTCYDTRHDTSLAIISDFGWQLPVSSCEKRYFPRPLCQRGRNHEARQHDAREPIGIRHLTDSASALIVNGELALESPSTKSLRIAQARCF
jgi:hypothetical protein